MELGCGGISQIVDGRDDSECISGGRYCMSSFGGGKQRSIGEKQDQTRLEGRVEGVGYWQPALQHGLMFKNMSSGIRQLGFGSWLYH